MNNKRWIYYKRNKERLQVKARDCYHQGGKEKARKYYEND